jgi:hypothetical protein
MTKFNRRASEPYTLITPLTPLAELAEFLQDNIFALGMAFRYSVIPYTSDLGVVVTDHGRNFVLAVATSQDLDVSRVSYRRLRLDVVMIDFGVLRIS